MADRYLCRDCSKVVTGTTRGRYRTHSGGDGEACVGSGGSIPEDLEPVEKGSDSGVPVDGMDYSACPQCERKVKLTRLGYFEPHDQTLRGGDRCPTGGIRAVHARKREDVPLPGDGPAPSPVPRVRDSETTSPAPTSASAGAVSSRTELLLRTGAKGPAPHEVNLARYPMVTSPASAAILQPSLAPEPATSSGAPGEPAESAAAGSVPPVLHLAPLLDARILQPFSHILQPTRYEKAVLQPMGDLAKELATKIKETFYAYSNRKSADNRSAQTTLGPSEIGTPCDRRLAMELMGVPHVNPGGDGWASFVGTCGHTGMGEVYTFADAGTGRYAVELPVFLGVPTVPRGTTDLLDRRDGTVVDWKFMGKYSLDKFKKEGPSETYRTQAHVYGYGAERAGEKVRNVAVVGLPRAGSSLDEMHIWTEPYDRKFAQDALARVERIAAATWTRGRSPQSDTVNMSVAREFPVGDDCRYCPFHLKGDREMRRGCPGE